MVDFTRVSSLLVHEQTNPQRLEEVRKDILSRGVIKFPLIVDRQSMVILDGHHRYRVLCDMGKQTAPVLLVDYACAEIQVFPRRADIPVSKKAVLKKARAGQLFPEKTTRHVLKSVQTEIDLPLESFN